MSQFVMTDDKENSTPNRFKVTIGRSNIWWIILCVIFWCGNMISPALFWNSGAFPSDTNWINPGEFILFVGAGLLASEIELLSLWGALGPQPAKFRIPICAALVLVSSCTYLLGLHLPNLHRSSGFPIDAAIGILGTLSGWYLLLLIPYLVLRNFLWFSDFMESISNKVTAKKNSQFGITYLLIATLTVAVLISVVKLLLPESYQFQSHQFNAFLSEMGFPILGFAFYSILLTLLATLVILCQRRSRIHGSAVVGIMFVFSIGPFFILAILGKHIGVIWTRQWFQALERTYACSFGLLLSVVVVMTVARFQGYRLRTRNDFL